MLRPYQETAIESLRAALKEDKKVVLSAPTGAGKTRIAAEIFALARARNSRVAFVVPFLSLIEQTYRAFVKNGLPQEDISIVQANHPLCNYARPIQICSTDTLVRRPVLPETDVVIFDECHRNSKLYKRWMEEAPQVKFVGLSATPWARGMAETWDDLIIVETTRGLINQKFLSDYKFFAPASPDLSGVSIIAGDYHEGQLGDAMNKTELVADIVTTWQDNADGRPTLCFCVNRAHARQVQYQFNKAGIQCGYVDANTPVDEREALIEKLRTGELNVIANIGTMTTGVDAPFVSCIILARPTKSEMLFIQIVGRGLRTAENKDHCLILDHSDTGLRLGLPCTINKTRLSKAKPDKLQIAREKGEIEKRLPRKCVKCDYVMPVGTLTCSHCGHTPERKSDVVIRDGKLMEIAPDATSAPMAPPVNIGETMQDWYGGLIYIAVEHGYKEGWAAHKFKERFGDWPEKKLKKVPTYPTQSMRDWVKSKQIAFAKAREKRKGAIFDARYAHRD